jgi:hypothetical protein
MKKIVSIFCLSLLLIPMGSYSAKQGNITNAKNKNICKEMKGKVLIYMVFVDTKNNDVWTDFDIKTAFESSGTVSDWLMANAKKRNVQMEIDIKYFQSGKTKTVVNNLPGKTIQSSISFPTKGMGSWRINKWSDSVARAVGKKLKFPGEVDNSIIKKPKNNVELISKLRDIYRVENVALIYLLNNNYTKDYSVAMNVSSNSKIEYGVASYKTPAELGHLIMHLFGAVDLKEDHYGKKIESDAASKWPNDIMANTLYTTPLEKLEINPLTEYLIGWKEQPDSSVIPYLQH